MGMASVALVLALVWLFGFMAERFRRKQKDLHRPRLATVISVAPTGGREGDLHEMQVTLDLAGTRPRRAEIRQLMTLDWVPRPGEVVRVEQDGSTLLLVGYAEERRTPASTSEPASRTPAAEVSSPKIVEAAELSPSLRDHGRLAIATVLEARPNGAGMTRFTLEMDAIHVPKRSVLLLQRLPEQPYTAGDRVYLLVNPKKTDSMVLLPPEATGGQKLPREMSRLDPYVLGPEMLRHGARGQGVVLAATPVSLAPEMELRGFHRFRLRFRIEPEAGLPPFEAEQTITLTRPEKIRRMAVPGALVPIRFDAADPQCFTTDSLALGYDDPYAEALALFRDQLREAEAK